MEELYVKLLELLGDIPELRYVDLDKGQLMEERPSIAYPCALIVIDMNKSEDIGGGMQLCNLDFTVRIVAKSLGETHNIAPQEVIERSLSWLRLQQKVYEKLQGYGDENFYQFSRRGGKNEFIRTGLNSFALHFETSYHDHSAS